VLNWQEADAFDFAITLCSLLLGVGYDAHVVYGTAPKEITTKDESLMECPFDLTYESHKIEPDPLVDEDEEKTAKKQNMIVYDNNIQVQQKPPRKSEFDEETKTTKEEEQKAAEHKEKHIDDDEPDYEPDDEFTRQRLHAWVLIRGGMRDMMHDIFIEPTTGR
jgi:hypothetical protein